MRSRFVGKSYKLIDHENDRRLVCAAWFGPALFNVLHNSFCVDFG